MTYEEAIEFTKINVEIYCKDCMYQDDCSRTDSCRCTEWEKMVVEALEKQIPKKPTFDFEWGFKCPHCNELIKAPMGMFRKKYRGVYTNIPNKMHRYCRLCGGCVDWNGVTKE